MPLINFSIVLNVLIALILYVLILILARQTKNSIILAVMLGVFLIITAGHAIEFWTVDAINVTVKNAIAKSLTYDLIFVALYFFSYLWVDDIEAKLKKRKSIDDSLEWFWTKV